MNRKREGFSVPFEIDAGLPGRERKVIREENGQLGPSYMALFDNLVHDSDFALEKIKKMSGHLA